ncbi:MAG: NAD/NADP octopine/nopaline dehydrogenase family protein [Burkholderiales bacterium]|nr:NAD/NADP octopine/nopaline dehydrogenase family protein [Burkholderiales bacterium]
MKVGIAGCGGIGLAYAAWLASRGHTVTIWSPRGDTAAALRTGPLLASGVLEASCPVAVADSAAQLAAGAEVLVVAVPVNGHRAVMNALLPHLASGQAVLVSSMASLSSLYLFEAARARGRDLTVMSLGTTVLTARRDGDHGVRIMTRRVEFGLSVLPVARQADALDTCAALFGDGFVAEANPLASTLSNINPVAHGPLAIFNWTRIERAESWPQYHYMTPKVAAVIERLDAERIALARAFGLRVRSLETHFAKSFSTTADTLAGIAAELHAKRGGPPGPTDIDTRFLAEDVPYGLVFSLALARLAHVDMPATRSVIECASLIAGCDFMAGNEFVAALRLECETFAGLAGRVAA